MKEDIDRGIRDKDAQELHAARQVFDGYPAITELGPWRVHAIITGRVQGVFYRAYVHRVASSLKLTGWVRNTNDGTVEVLAEGTRPLLEELLDKLRQGPPLAKVDGIKTEWRRATGEYTAFDIRV